MAFTDGGDEDEMYSERLSSERQQEQKTAKKKVVSSNIIPMIDKLMNIPFTLFFECVLKLLFFLDFD